MGNGFQFIDIIFFALVAAFLVLRLRSVLGRRTGNEKEQPDLFKPPAESKDEKIVRFPSRASGDEEDDEAGETPARRASEPLFSGPAAAGLTRIRQADPSFAPEGFLQGATAAFEMIVGAFAAGDEAALRPLLADAVMDGFSAAIRARKEAGETLSTEIVSLKKAEIIEADLETNLENRMARVTVRFVSEQVNTVKDKEGAVVDGDPNRVAEVVDLWTFQRDTRSRDPNWTLTETRNPD